MDKRQRMVIAAALILTGGSVFAQAMYKYKGENDEWIFTDKAPPREQVAEILRLPTGREKPTVSVTTRLFNRQISFNARNTYAVPVEVMIALDELRNLELPRPDQTMRWVVGPNSDLMLFQLQAIADNAVPEAFFRFGWLPGEPAAQHAANHLYRVPFAMARDHSITQTFPIGNTHRTPDAYYAVDVAMPIGTGIYGARAGTVFEVANTNFRGGTDSAQDMAAANIVRIMHDDGSHAVYAHLNLNSVRVRPGDRVERGQYIADSGNTGFSSGPHLHFVVMVNSGTRLVSMPVLFEGPNMTAVKPVTGDTLLAY